MLTFFCFYQTLTDILCGIDSIFIQRKSIDCRWYNRVKFVTTQNLTKIIL
jgi:hypothetical protein